MKSIVEVIFGTGLSWREKAVLLSIVGAAGGGERAHVSVDQLASRASMGRSTVFKYLGVLERGGYIYRHKCKEASCSLNYFTVRRDRLVRGITSCGLTPTIFDRDQCTCGVTKLTVARDEASVIM